MIWQSEITRHLQENESDKDLHHKAYNHRKNMTKCILYTIQSFQTQRLN